MSSIDENNENNDSSENNTTFSYEFTVYPNTINQDLLDIFNIFDNRITNVVRNYNPENTNLINDVQTYVNSTEPPRNIAQSPMLTIPAFNPSLITFRNPPTEPLDSIYEDNEPVDESEENSEENNVSEETNSEENSEETNSEENSEETNSEESIGYNNLIEEVNNNTTSDVIEDNEHSDPIEPVNNTNMPDTESINQNEWAQTGTLLRRNLTNGGISWHIPNSPIRNTQRRRRINVRLQNLFNLVYQQDLENQILNQVLQESFEEEQERQLIDMARELDISKITKSECKDEQCDCRICLCDYEETDELGILPCKHSFHYSCIQEWGKRKPNCPYCDVEIPVVKPNDDRATKKQKTN